MKQFLAVQREAARAVGHQALTLRDADGLAQIGFFGDAVIALAAFRHIERYHVVTFFQRGHARPHVDHDARAFVPQYGREQALGISA